MSEQKVWEKQHFTRKNGLVLRTYAICLCYTRRPFYRALSTLGRFSAIMGSGSPNFSNISRWWQLKYFGMFTPILGVSWSNLTVRIFFEIGWWKTTNSTFLNGLNCYRWRFDTFFWYIFLFSLRNIGSIWGKIFTHFEEHILQMGWFKTTNPQDAIVAIEGFVWDHLLMI